jgi:putative oxidoreductase
MQESFARHTHWLLRGALAAVFAFHGYAKLTDNPSMQAKMLGIPVGLLLLTGLAELGGALLIAVGSVRIWRRDSVVRRSSR